MVRGFAEGVKRWKVPGATKGIAKGTLPFRGFRLTNVRQKTGVRGAELGIVDAGLKQAQLPVHGQTNLGGVVVLLAVVLPPADRAQLKGSRGFEGSIPAAGTAKTGFRRNAHTK